jgi:hypothetical protein
MSETAKLAEWLRRLDAIAEAVVEWRAACLRPFTSAEKLRELESRIGQNLIEILGRPE